MSLSSPFHSKKRSESGAAALEFAIVASLLFMVLFGVFEFGRIFNELEVLNSAAREGARVAAVRGTSDEITEATEAAADPYELHETPTADKVCGDATSGQPVTVSWDQNFEISVGLLPAFDKDIQIKGVFRCE